MPAILKGMFDRIWLPGFAFKFRPNGLWWDGLLKGRTARVFVTSDAPPIFTRIIFGDTTNEIRKGILWFAGISVSVKKIGPLKRINEQKKQKWLSKFKKWGKCFY
jgi:putative NADPH-quinone reductase